MMNEKRPLSFDQSDEEINKPKKRKDFSNFTCLGDNALEKLFRNNSPTITINM